MFKSTIGPPFCHRNPAAAAPSHTRISPQSAALNLCLQRDTTCEHGSACGIQRPQVSHETFLPEKRVAYGVARIVGSTNQQHSMGRKRRRIRRGHHGGERAMYCNSNRWSRDFQPGVDWRPAPATPDPSRTASSQRRLTRLSSVEWPGTTNLLLPHLRHLSGETGVSALIGSGMTLRPFWSNYRRRGVAERGKTILKTAFVKANHCASGWHPLFAGVSSRHRQHDQN